jgi:nicotinate-nucleotide adenylyltransferase
MGIPHDFPAAGVVYIRRMTTSPPTGSEAQQSPAATGAADLPAHAPGGRIGLFGGSFDPPHEGHRLASLAALERLGLDAVWRLVTPGNPLKDVSGLPDLEARVQAAKELAGDPRIAVTGIERRLGTRYTVDTVAALQGLCPGVRFVLIVGADVLAELPRWKDWERLMRLVPLAVVDRPGYAEAALHGEAAADFAAARIAGADAASLADRAPPAWVFLEGTVSALSSTALRRAAGRP